MQQGIRRNVMQWFSNLKIAQKLILSFVLVAAIAGVIGYVGITKLRQVSKNDDILFRNDTVSIEYLSTISTSFQRVRIGVYTIINADTKEEIASNKSSIETNQKTIAEYAGKLEKLIETDEMRKSFDEFNKGLDAYYVRLAEVIGIAERNEDELALTKLQDMRDIAGTANEVVAGLVELKNKEAENRSKTNMDIAGGAVKAMGIALFIGVALALLLGFTLARLIGNPLRNLTAIADKLAAGDVNVQVQATTKDEIGDLMMSFEKMIGSIRGVVDETKMLVRESLEGRLEKRGNADQFQGGYHEIVKGINDTLDSIIAPIIESLKVIESMAEGDLSKQVTGNYKGDLSKMKDALNLTLESLNDILGQVNIAADQVVSGSQQVSDASQSLSQGATEQASSLEEITASMTEMTSQTKQNAENAQQANVLAASARDNATRGNEQMQGMLSAMSEINESSGQISKIIKVIDEIAFQTNLLALNAAVEAARAGVHGKGFAVVADEVRNLAQRSAKAAKETTELIETSIKKVDNGTGIANETAKALTEIVSGVTKVTDLVGEIASASNEQAQGISQVNQGLGQVDQVTQANTANAEESASAAEELSGQAVNLKHMIGRFTLAGNTRIAQAGYSAVVQPERISISAGSNSGNGKKAKGLVPVASGNGKSKKGAGDRLAAVTVSPTDVIALDDEEFGKY
jgi:methyl-accepting chemotaxis protein